MKLSVLGGLITAAFLFASAALAGAPLNEPPPPVPEDMTVLTCGQYLKKDSVAQSVWQYWVEGTKHVPVSKVWMHTVNRAITATCRKAPDGLAIAAATDIPEPSGVTDLVDYSALTCSSLMSFIDNDVTDFLYWLHGFRVGETGHKVLDPILLSKVAWAMRGPACRYGEKNLVAAASAEWDRLEQAAAP